jgi:hypothetical protein
MVSTATETADDDSPPPLLLLEDGVGPEVELEEVAEEITSVDGPFATVEEVPMNVPEGPFVLGKLVPVRVDGMELPPRLHSGLPVESR